VPKDSAILTAYPSKGIQANHASLAKFKNETDWGFLSIASELRGWVDQVKGTPENQDLQKSKSVPLQNKMVIPPVFDDLQTRDSQRLLQWLSSLDFEGRQDALYSKHFSGTGDWLLNSSKFKSWRSFTDHNSPSFFCCIGPRKFPCPNCGTMLKSNPQLEAENQS
jgi:hypothetical protein